MPIILPRALPAYDLLEKEGYNTLAKEEVAPASVRIGLLNLMPNKEVTEAHFARVLSHTLAPVELALIRLSSYESKNTAPEHLAQFYEEWETTKTKPLHGIIITGAPVEHLDYEAVEYWEELCGILDWVQEHDIPALFICWAAQAAIYRYYSVKKKDLPQKRLGLFPHRMTKPDALLRGFNDVFEVPVARNTEIPTADLEALDSVDILSESDLSGVYVARDKTHPHYYVFNHLEYTSDTIVEEYFRELRDGKEAPVPYNYFPSGDTKQNPLNRWRAHASLLYSNWIHECSQPVFHYRKHLNIAIAGLGTVGGNVVKLLQQHREMLEQRTGCGVKIVGVSARDKSKKRASPIPDDVTWCDDPLDLLKLPDLDIVIELIGGRDGVARELVHKALEGRKHVITANKALMAREGLSLIAKAEKEGVVLAFEAAVGGAVPAIKTMREALAGDNMSSIAAILNGTANYILHSMEYQDVDLDVALKAAQDRGYAEADPTADIDGLDAAHKINVLACMAFGCNTRFEELPVTGIRNITRTDIRAAKQFGYRIKLLAQSWKEEQKIGSVVSPYLVAHHHPLAGVEGAHNAILYTGSFVGELFMRGFGAGGEPTAAAVVSDLLDIVRQRRAYAFGIPADAIPTLPMAGAYWPRPYYLRSAQPFDLNGAVAEQAEVDEQYVAITVPYLSDEADKLFEKIEQVIPLYIPETVDK